MHMHIGNTRATGGTFEVDWADLYSPDKCAVRWVGGGYRSPEEMHQMARDIQAIVIARRKKRALCNDGEGDLNGKRAKC